jgi:hypothetical protein
MYAQEIGAGGQNDLVVGNSLVDESARSPAELTF